jgi:hypothetical protein
MSGPVDRVKQRGLSFRMVKGTRCWRALRLFCFSNTLTRALGIALCLPQYFAAQSRVHISIDRRGESYQPNPNSTFNYPITRFGMFYLSLGDSCRPQVVSKLRVVGSTSHRFPYSSAYESQLHTSYSGRVRSRLNLQFSRSYMTVQRLLLASPYLVTLR